MEVVGWLVVSTCCLAATLTKTAMCEDVFTASRNIESTLCITMKPSLGHWKLPAPRGAMCTCCQ
jgi:hypothetical protein